MRVTPTEHWKTGYIFLGTIQTTSFFWKGQSSPIGKRNQLCLRALSGAELTNELRNSSPSALLLVMRKQRGEAQPGRWDWTSGVQGPVWSPVLLFSADFTLSLSFGIAYFILLFILILLIQFFIFLFFLPSWRWSWQNMCRLKVSKALCIILENDYRNNFSIHPLTQL